MADVESRPFAPSATPRAGRRFVTQLGWAAACLGLLAPPVTGEAGTRWYASAGPAGIRSQGVRLAKGESVLVPSTPGGTTIGLQLGAGKFLSPRLSLELEFCRSGRLQEREPARYGDTFHEERQDQFFMLNQRLHLRVSRRLVVEPLAGLGLVRQAGARTTEHVSWLTGIRARSGRGPLEPWLDGAAAVGLDLRLGGPRFAAVSSVRLRGTLNGSRYEDWWGEATARFSVVVGVLGRVEF